MDTFMDNGSVLIYTLTRKMYLISPQFMLLSNEFIVIVLLLKISQFQVVFCVWSVLQKD